jgi:Protein of unknown function (DUF3102)
MPISCLSKDRGNFATSRVKIDKSGKAILTKGFNKMNRMPVSEIDLSTKVFDYTDLDVEISQFVQQQTGEIQALVKRTAQDIIEIGQKLNAVKEKLKHGRFTDWIEAEFHWSYPTAARFMQVADRFGDKIYQIDKFAPSAMYELAAPSTPKLALEEAIAIATAGESITYSKAKALKQKYSPSAAKTKPAATSANTATTNTPTTNTPTTVGMQQIIAIRSQPTQPIAPLPAEKIENVSSREIQVSPPEQQICWHLEKDHILYCDEPNSPTLRQRLPEKLKLLLAFPPVPNWQTDIPADTRIIATRYLPKGKNSELLENTLEALLDLYTEIGETVAICYLPFPKILDVLNRFERRGILVEPDRKQVNEIVSYWKKGYMKVKEVSL